MTDVREGDVMPRFSLPDSTGQVIKSDDLVGRGPLVIFFYPKDETAGCTAEACGFRDQYEDFVAAGATVVGISRDDAASHEKFAAHHRLPFGLLSDKDGTVARAFGVTKVLGVLPSRETFIIDNQSVIRRHISSQIFPLRHVKEALAAVQALQATVTAGR